MEIFSSNLSFLRKKAGRSKQDQADFLAVKRTTYSGYESGASKPDFSTLMDMAERLGIKPGQLIDDFIDENTKLDSPTKHKDSIPLIPIDAMAGYPAGEFQVLHAERYVIPEFRNQKVDFLIRISGTSMSPKYFNGDVVACKLIPTNSFIQWGKVYIMDTVQGALCKRLYQGSKKGHVKVVSDNSEAYPAFEIDFKENVRSLALVVGVIRMEN